VGSVSLCFSLGNDQHRDTELTELRSEVGYVAADALDIAVLGALGSR
jgi:hypothetical protein